MIVRKKTNEDNLLGFKKGYDIIKQLKKETILINNEQLENDIINHPKHYTQHPSGVECIDIIEHMSFNVGAAIKYLWRAGMKDPVVQDLKKAVWFINREIQRLSK